MPNLSHELLPQTDPESPLETPGKIAVIGGGILGIEAALYGRYLGYKVALFDAGEIGEAAIGLGDEPLPMLPDRSFSPLAASALAAQTTDRPETLPVTCGDWARRILIPLTHTDLLRGQVFENAAVSKISHVGVPVQEEVTPESDVAKDAVSKDAAPQDRDDGELDVPDDFQLSFADNRPGETFEAVIVAISDDRSLGGIETTFDLPAPYLFGLCWGQTDSAEANFAIGLRRVVSVYANLGDRSDLDLYAPRRG